MSGIVRNNPDCFWVFLKPLQQPPQFCPQHSHPWEYEWFYCREGGGIQVVGDWQQQITVGQLLLIPPGAPHVFCADAATGCRCDVLMQPQEWFDGEDPAAREGAQLMKFLRASVSRRGYLLDLPQEHTRKVAEWMRQMQNWLKAPRFGNAMRLNGAMHGVMLAVSQLPEAAKFLTAQSLAKDEVIGRLLYFLHNHLSENISVDEALQITNLKKSAFHPRFQKATGTTFCRYINHLRVKAVEDMIDRGASLESAIRQCGFGSRSNYFEQRKNCRAEQR